MIVAHDLLCLDRDVTEAVVCVYVYMRVRVMVVWVGDHDISCSCANKEGRSGVQVVLWVCDRSCGGGGEAQRPEAGKPCKPRIALQVAYPVSLAHRCSTSHISA